MPTRWHWATDHPARGADRCTHCCKAAETAKTDAMMDRLDSATHVVIDAESNIHAATVTRPTLKYRQGVTQ